MNVFETSARCFKNVSSTLSCHLPLQPPLWRQPLAASTTVGHLRRHRTVVTHHGVWGDKLVDKVDETFLKHFPIVSNTFHTLYPAILRCLDTPPLALMACVHLEPSGGIQEARRHPGATQEPPRGTQASRGHLESRSHKNCFSLSVGMQQILENVDLAKAF